MKVNLALALATMLSAALGGAVTGYGQQYYNVSHSATYGEGCACETSCPCEEEEEEEACDPWRLFPEFGCGWKLTGFINAGATANADGPARLAH